MVVDAFVETSIDGGLTWERSTEWRIGSGDFTGPWSVPHAIEIARGAWAMMLRIAGVHSSVPPARVRVIDTAGVVVEQWPRPRP
jgi:hypothetical protein